MRGRSEAAIRGGDRSHLGAMSTRLLKLLICAAALAALLSSCGGGISGSHFGLSRSGDSLVFWYDGCGGSPDDVAMTLNGSSQWDIVANGSAPSEFPHSVVVGQVPSGYRLVTPLTTTPRSGLQYKFTVGSGEVWFQSFAFTLTGVPTDQVVTFDNRVVSQSMFLKQAC